LSAMDMRKRIAAVRLIGGSKRGYFGDFEKKGKAR
jgi:hypothetical protein